MIELPRGARMIGIGFNGPKDRGHLVAFVVTPDILRIIGHPKKGETVDFVRQEHAKGLPVDVWHQIRIEFKGETLAVTFKGETFTATHPSIAEEKHTFSLGGDSGGPEGEKAGAEERAVQYFLQRMNFLFSYSGLLEYKAKFATRWEPRYVIYRHVLELPRLAVALLRVSGLPGGKRGHA